MDLATLIRPSSQGELSNCWYVATTWARKRMEDSVNCYRTHLHQNPNELIKIPPKTLVFFGASTGTAQSLAQLDRKTAESDDVADAPECECC
jgi:hypothetical protein